MTGSKVCRIEAPTSVSRLEGLIQWSAFYNQQSEKVYSLVSSISLTDTWLRPSRYSDFHYQIRSIVDRIRPAPRLSGTKDRNRDRRQPLLHGS